MGIERRKTRKKALSASHSIRRVWPCTRPVLRPGCGIGFALRRAVSCCCTPCTTPPPLAPAPLVPQIRVQTVRRGERSVSGVTSGVTWCEFFLRSCDTGEEARGQERCLGACTCLVRGKGRFAEKHMCSRHARAHAHLVCGAGARSHSKTHTHML